jgi:hypothetical protein
MTAVYGDRHGNLTPPWPCQDVGATALRREWELLSDGFQVAKPRRVPEPKGCWEALAGAAHEAGRS